MRERLADKEWEVIKLREKLAKAERPTMPETDAVAELRRQLKAAQTRIKNLSGENNRAWRAATKNPANRSKAQLRKLQKALHPDGEALATAERRAVLNEAFQIFSDLKIHVVEPQ